MLYCHIWKSAPCFENIDKVLRNGGINAEFCRFWGGIMRCSDTRAVNHKNKQFSDVTVSSRLQMAEMLQI